MYNKPICLHRCTQMTPANQTPPVENKGGAEYTQNRLKLKRGFDCKMRTKTKCTALGRISTKQLPASSCSAQAVRTNTGQVFQIQKNQEKPCTHPSFSFVAQEHDAILLPAWSPQQEGQGYPAADGSLSESAIHRTCFPPASGTASSDPCNQKKMISKEACKSHTFFCSIILLILTFSTETSL